MEGARSHVVTLGRSKLCKKVECLGDAILVPQILVEGQTVFIGRTCRCMVALKISQSPQRTERPGASLLLLLRFWPRQNFLQPFSPFSKEMTAHEPKLSKPYCQS